MQIEKNIKDVDNRLRALSQRVLAVAKPPKLIAISKNQPKERIQAALDVGQRVFGENRLQEAQKHWEQQKNHYSDLELHFVGHLQSNKAMEIVELFDYIHSIDRESAALAVKKAMQKLGKQPPCFIQVNTGEEPQKSGVLPGDAPEFIRKCREEWDLPVIGLMCVPPVGVNSVPHFAFLKKLAEENDLTELSMGMSDDWELAVRMGATYIRLGSAIFGERE